MQYLPIIPSVPHYDFTTTVDGSRCLFEFRWNERDEAWRFDLREIDGTAVAIGVKVVLGVPLARTCRHRLVIEGAFLAYDREGSAIGKGVDATLHDFGARLLIVHVTSMELAALILAQAAA